MVQEDINTITAPDGFLLGDELKLAPSGVMSARGASPRSCDFGVVRMLQNSEEPYFGKTMTHHMLQKALQLVIPKNFFRTHGHMLDTEISLTGPNGHTRSVEIKTYPARPSGFRRYLSHGWREFAKENGFRTGDRVIFRLVGNSSFHVVVPTQLQEKEVFQTPPVSCVLPKCDEESGLDNYGRNGMDLRVRLHRKVTANQATTTVPKCEINFNPAELPVQLWHCGAPDNGNVVAAMKSPLRRTGHFKNPGLDSAISSISRFPWFISKLTKTSMGGQHLELPIRFAKEHGHKFQARVVLLGPNGCWRIVKLKVSSTVRTTIRVQFRQGWKDFLLENGFNEGDVLTFSLVGFSKFVVQVFPEAKYLQ